MKNNFTTQTRELFLYNYACWKCGRNTWDVLHHIVGRGLGESKLESSSLNACPICNYPCHIGQALQSKEKMSEFLKKTLQFLELNGYMLVEKDRLFIEKYKEYYD